MRKVYVEARVQFIVRADDDVDFDEYLDTIECSLSSGEFNADIENVEISNFLITDSK